MLRRYLYLGRCHLEPMDYWFNVNGQIQVGTIDQFLMRNRFWNGIFGQLIHDNRHEFMPYTIVVSVVAVDWCSWCSLV